MSGPPYRYGQRSMEILDTCHPYLQILAYEAIKYRDITILKYGGHRSKTIQDSLYEAGASQVKYPGSYHNHNPSLALDSSPYPVDWNDLGRFGFHVGWLMGLWQKLKAQGDVEGILVSGIDWDGDGETKDTKFFDYPHVQLELPVTILEV